MEINWTTIIVGLIAALPGLLALLKGRKKEGADAASAIVSSSLSIVNQLEDNVKCLQQDVTKLKRAGVIYKRNQTKLIKGVEMLTNQLQQLGHMPVWTIEQACLEEVDTE